MLSLEELRGVVRGKVLISEPMSDHTTIGVGGPADFFVEPVDRDDLCRAVTFFRRHRLPCLVLGRGSNLLVHDDGVRGAVIAASGALCGYRIRRDGLVASAGEPLSLLAARSFEAGLGGIEMLQGIPGTLGGALVMNAGAWGQQMSDVVVSVDVFDGDRVRTLKREAIGFAYRCSGLDDTVVLGAALRLRHLSEADVRERTAAREEAMRRRKATQPLSWPNAGSIFRNPLPGESPDGLGAGAMIEQCGLKGLGVGGAVISDVHANMIINTGGATASDVMELIHRAREAVSSRFGVMLELEVMLAGFENACC
ncbi:MAG: UDP-N-acetylmuramate dehydrogenase [Prosthecochloris sp.]|nr:UDP-N-acetylmuramate dehydrogenase [Prosthecochloris sp.]